MALDDQDQPAGDAPEPTAPLDLSSSGKPLDLAGLGKPIIPAAPQQQMELPLDLSGAGRPLDLSGAGKPLATSAPAPEATTGTGGSGLLGGSKPPTPPPTTAATATDGQKFPDTGIFAAATQGIADSIHDFANTGAAINRDDAQDAGPKSLAQQPVEWGDLLKPGTLAEKTIYGLARSAPSLAGGVAGGIAGTALGGGPEEPIGWAGGILGGAVGAGAVGAAQALGPFYAAALKANPKDPDAAFDAALKTASVEGATSGLSWAAFGWAPFKSTVKNLMFQAFGVQPTAAAVGQVAQNAAEGQPLTQGVAESLPGAVVGTAVPMLGHAAVTHGVGMLRGHGATPSGADLMADAAAAGTKQPIPAQADQMAADLAAVQQDQGAAPAGPPKPGDALGLKFPKGPSQRATVDQYFDNGQSVRLRFDDGSVRDFLTADVLRDRTAPPPPMGDVAAPAGRVPRGPGEDESFNLMMEGERAAQAAMPQRQPSTPVLGREGIQALQQAEALEFRAANDPDRTAEQRADDYAAAQSLRRKYGASKEPQSFSQDQIDRAAQQRTPGLGTPLMGQNVPPIGNTPMVYSDEQLAMAAATRRKQAAQRNAEAAAAKAQADSDKQAKADAAAQKPPRRPDDLIDFLSQNGGIRDDTGDLTEMGADQWHLGKKFRRKLVRDDGQSLPSAFEKANEAGYGPYHDEAEFLDGVRENLRGNPQFAAADQTQAAHWEESLARQKPMREQLLDEAHNLGLTIPDGWSGPEILAEIDERKGIITDGASGSEAADRMEAAQDEWLRELHPDLYGEIHPDEQRATETARQPAAAADHPAGIPGSGAPAGGAGATAAVPAVGPGGGEAAGQGARPHAQGIVPSTPEPRADILAQIATMAGGQTKKDAVFVARGNEDAIPRDLPPHVVAVARPEGVLLTTDEEKAERFRDPKLTDSDLAEILGYPVSKAEALASGAPVAIQGTDKAGNVVAEAITSPQRARETAAAIADQTPADGKIKAVTGEELQQRRDALVSQEEPLPPETLGTRAQPIKATTAEHVGLAERHVNTAPTEGQKEAGNYAKGHLKLHGLDIAIENPKGSVRRGVGPDGEPWEVTMPAAYGYIKKTEGADGDHVDTFVGPNPESDKVFLIDQHEPMGKFDEHKAMIGFDDAGAAFDAYYAAFSDGRSAERMGHVVEMTVDQFKDWLKRGDTTAPARAAVNPVNPMELHAIKHTKTGADLFAVRLTGERVDPDRFKELSKAAKALGGYYSSYRAKGAVPGWQFKTRAAAEEFMRDNGGGLAPKEGAVAPKAPERATEAPAVAPEAANVKPEAPAVAPAEAAAATEPENPADLSTAAVPAETPQQALDRADAAYRQAFDTFRAAEQTFSAGHMDYPAFGEEQRKFAAAKDAMDAAERAFREATGATEWAPSREQQASPAAPENTAPALLNRPEQPTLNTEGQAAPASEEAQNGVPEHVPASDAGAGPEAVHGSAQERPVGSPPPAENPRGVPDAGSRAGAGAEGQRRPAEEPRGGEGGGAPRPGNDAGLPAAEGPGHGGTAGRPAADRGVVGKNFTIEPGAVEEGRTPRTKAADNLAAIELAKRLIADDRPATRDEQAILAKYVGWGGLAGAFENGKGQFAKGFEKTGARLKDLLTDEEHKTAARSTQYAHYTAENVIRGMWDAIGKMGFKGGLVFEPGMGVGHFLGMMPPDLADHSKYQGIEMDHLTADIAKLLYPESGVRQADYTRAPVPDNTFDLVIGNPPFSDTVIQADPKYAARGFMLHDYFFAKSLDSVRPGGLLGFVTSAGTMNKGDAAARQYMAERADFLGGVRLPSSAFKQNAGTEVTTDILFFKKRPEIVPFEAGAHPDWTQTVQREFPNPRTGAPEQVNVSRYFAEHPEQILGDEGLNNTQYATARYGVEPRAGQDLTADLAAAMDRLPKDVMEPLASPEQRAAVDFSASEKKDGSYYLQDGKLMQYRSGAGTPVEARGAGVKGGMSMTEMQRVRQMVPVRDALRDVFRHDLARNEEGAAEARQRLNRFYDNFVRQFGPINKADFQYRRPNAVQAERLRAEARETARDQGVPFEEGDFDPTGMIDAGASWAEIGRQRKAARERATAAGKPFDEGTFDEREIPDIVIEKRPNIDPFMDDPESYRLRSIEHYNESTGVASKKRIFTENILTHEEPPKLASAGDGVMWSMNKFGRLDLDAIADEMGKDRQAIVDELGDKVFRIPGTTGDYVTNDEYLSGDVVDKLATARAEAERDPAMRRNVEALEKAQPVPVSPSAVRMKLGMPWIPLDTIEGFARDHLGIGDTGVVYSPATGSWTTLRKSSGPRVKEWGTEGRSAHALLNDALNSVPPKIYKDVPGPDGRLQSVFDAVGTQAAVDKYNAMRAAFEEYAHAPERGDTLARLYNDKMNRVVLRQYDGSYLTTPGVSADWSWRPHQQRVVARIIQAGNTYMAHAVGAGKAQPLDAKVLTPTGWVRMGDLRVGDLVIAGDGTPTRVIGVFPQGELEIFSVTFSDGGQTECCDEHLWLTQNYAQRTGSSAARKKGKVWAFAQPSVRRLAEIRASIVGRIGAKNHSIPVVGAVDFARQDVPLDPYLLGVLLGDGCLRPEGITISSADEDLVRGITLPENIELRLVNATRKGCPEWRLTQIKKAGYGKNQRPNPVGAALVAMGLVGAKSADKFVPQPYLWNDAATRLGILQGLLDTDGSISRRGHSVYFYSVSNRLADDVIFLVRSLGGTVRRSVKIPTYRHNGERRTGQPCHILCLKLPPGVLPFRLKRKADLVKPKSKYPPIRYIVSANPIGMKAAQCIAVEHPSHLYVTDDFVVTHNTSAMIGAGMEMRRLGLVRKPMYVVPGHMLGQFAKEFYEQYPTARIAIADDRRFHTDRRKQFMADVAQNDLDAVIIPHSSFGMIPISDEFQAHLIQEELDKLDEALANLPSDETARITRKRIEKQKEKLEQKLSTRGNARQDQTQTFEEMGTDFLFVDEAHKFRKLAYATKQSGLKGLSPEGSNMAWDLYAKMRYLDSQKPGRSAVLASGTPITNTMGELYSLSRFLQPQELDKRGLAHFDSWASTFGETKNELEQTPAGDYAPVTRFSRFVNTPELYKMVGDIMDTVTPEQLEQYVVRPKFKGGERQPLHLAPRTAFLDAYQAELGARMEAIKKRKGPPQKGDDILLSVINDGRHSALDPRFVDPAHPSDPDSKLNQMIDNVHRIWKQTKNQQFYDPKTNYQTKLDRGPATQMVFANIGIGDQRGFSGYQWMKSELLRRGVPRDQIAFIGDYKSAVARQKLFNDMNEGKVRILVGSTDKMGTGVNAQRRLVALHNQDPLWFPSDDEQRVGRILRQGNTNPEIEVHDYSTKGTYDSVMWQMMGRKARFIEAFFRGDPNMREMEDLGQASMYEQASAIATSDPRIIELTEKKQDLARAQRRYEAHDREQYAMRQGIEDANRRIGWSDKRLAEIQQDIDQRQETRGKAFKMDVAGQSLTKRPEAAATMAARVGEIFPQMKDGSDARIGSIGGFPLMVRKNAFGKTKVPEYFLLRNGDREEELSATGASGAIAAAENRIAKLEEGVAHYTREKAYAQQTIEENTPQLGKEFQGHAEIARLQQEIKDLESGLAPQEAPKPEEPPPEAEEPPALAEPGEKKPAGATAIDQTAAFRQQFGDPVGPAAHTAARDYVTDRGAATGNEYLAAVTGDGRVALTSTSDRPASVTFSLPLLEMLVDPAHAVTVHHNHPSGSPLGGTDMASLGLPGMRQIVAYGRDGAAFSAQATPEMAAALRGLPANAAVRAIQDLYQAADAAVRANVMPLFETGEISRDDANRIHYDIINRSLAAARLIDYVSTQDLAPLSRAQAERFIADAAQSVRDAAPSVGLGKGVGDEVVQPDRHADALRADDAMARISGANAAAAAGRSGRPVGDRGGGEGIGEPAPAGGGLAQERGPYDEQPEVRPTGKDYLDDVADQIAATVKGGGGDAGTYARRLAQALPPDGAPLGTKQLGKYEKFVIQPRTMAATDWRSARYWDEWRRKDQTANTLRNDWSDQSKGYVDLTQAQRRALHGVEELDRINGVVRPDDGRRIVVRNEDNDETEFSKPGQSIALDPKTTAAYHERRALFRDVWRSLMGASAKRLGWDGDLDPDAIRAAAKKPLLPAGEAKRLNNIADLMEAMGAQEKTAYTPLMRFGDYYIAVKPKEGTAADSLGGFPQTKRFLLVDSKTPFSSLFGSVTKGNKVPEAATKAIADLRKRYGPDFDIEHGYLAKNAEVLRKLDIPAVEKMFMALNQKDSELFGPMVDQLRQKMYEEMKAGFKKRSRTVPGYSTDFERATGAYLGWTSSHVAEMLHGEAIRQAQEAYIAKHPDPSVQRYWKKWTDYQNDPAEEMQKLRQFGFYWALAGNPSSMALIATHGPMVAHATLGVGHGYVRTGKTLYGALGEAIKAITFDTTHGLHVDMAKVGRTPAEKALIDSALKTGQLHPAAAEDIRGLGQNSMESLEPVRKTWGRMLNIAASTVGVTDQMNRIGVLLAEHRLASEPGQLTRLEKTWGSNEIFKRMVKRDGLTPETAAKFMVDEGLYVWGKRNRAPIQRGTAGTMLFQFRNFETNYLGTLWKMMHRMGPEGKGAALFMMAGLGLLGGATGLPFVEDLEKGADALGKMVTGVDPMIDAHIAEMLEDAGMSQMGAEAFLKGPARSVLGIDLNSRLGFGEAASKNLSATEALGVVPSMLVQRAMSGFNRYESGQPLGAAAEALPSALRNLMRGTIVLPAEGVRGQYGNVVVPKGKITGGEQTAQALGFEPANVARAYEQSQYAKRTAKAGQDLHSRILSQATELVAEAYERQKAGDAAGVASAQQRLTALLQAHPDVRIAPASIKAQLLARENALAAALKHAPKSTRGTIMNSPYVSPQ